MRSGVFIVDFQQNLHIVLVFLLLYLNRWMPAGLISGKKLHEYLQICKNISYKTAKTINPINKII